jgi:hypothetical protein
LNNESRELSSTVFVRGLVARMSPAERETMLQWMQDILEIKNSETSAASKTKRALQLTAKASAILPFIKIIGQELKRIGWNERGLPARLGLSAMVGAVALFGTTGGGIAAFGGAVGVPLWILFGGGGLAAGALIDELRKPKSDDDSNDQQGE